MRGHRRATAGAGVNFTTTTGRETSVDHHDDDDTTRATAERATAERATTERANRDPAELHRYIEEHDCFPPWYWLD